MTGRQFRWAVEAAGPRPSGSPRTHSGEPWWSETEGHRDKGRLGYDLANVFPLQILGWRPWLTVSQPRDLQQTLDLSAI